MIFTKRNTLPEGSRDSQSEAQREARRRVERVNTIVALIDISTRKEIEEFRRRIPNFQKH